MVTSESSHKRAFPWHSFPSTSPSCRLVGPGYVRLADDFEVGNAVSGREVGALLVSRTQGWLESAGVSHFSVVDPCVEDSRFRRRLASVVVVVWGHGFAAVVGR